MFSMMRMTGVVQRYGVFQREVNGDKNAPKLLTCRELLEFATINGARTMNADSKVGTLAPGKEADLLMLKADSIDIWPLNNAYGSVVGLMGPSHVEAVFIAGQVSLRANRHDCLNLAQSTAYSAMVSLFPALIVAAAVVSLLPDTAPLRFQLSAFFDRILPPDVSPLLQSYFVDAPHSLRSTHALIVAFLVSLIGASSVIATLMEGVRRANDLPIDCWTFWQRRLRAFLLVPLSLVPFVLASTARCLRPFHHRAGWPCTSCPPLAPRSTSSLSSSAGSSRSPAASASSPSSTTWERPCEQSWKRVLPGAIVSTAMWFLATLVFGWYVTRFANYSQVYGSLGAGIALLFWLYIISLSVLCGAEFNTEFHARLFIRRIATHSTPSSPNTLPPG